MALSASSKAATSAARAVMPRLVVFDLDDCLWHPEMYTLSKVPNADSIVKGKLGDMDSEGVIAVKSGHENIQLYVSPLTM